MTVRVPAGDQGIRVISHRNRGIPRDTEDLYPSLRHISWALMLGTFMGKCHVEMGKREEHNRDL